MAEEKIKRTRKRKHNPERDLLGIKKQVRQWEKAVDRIIGELKAYISSNPLETTPKDITEKLVRISIDLGSINI